MRKIIAILSVTVAACGATKPLAYPEIEAIRTAQMVSVHALEPELPDVPLDSWLRSTLQVSAIPWEIYRGCGDPQRERQDQVCVFADIRFREDLNVGISVLVGDYSRLSPTPSLDMLFMERPGGSHFRGFRSLAEMRELFREQQWIGASE